MLTDQPILPRSEPIPGYRLIERLGRGGYGEVWKVEAPGGIHKAIKFVYGDMDGGGLGDDGKAAEQEFKSLNRVKSIRHPFLLSIERIDVIHGRLTIIMELADRNLWDRFNECVVAGMPGIPRPELIRYMEETAEALDLMNVHHQIQHLDIKPQNIFLVQQHVKVADFGLAKDLEGARASVTGGVTPTYAPPETFEGWVSRQSDQYSLAIVYQEMLTGQRPFNGNNTRQLILQHMTAPPDVSVLPTPDRHAVAQALAKTPGERFKTCGEFVQALKGEFPVRIFVTHAVQSTQLAETPTEMLGDTEQLPEPSIDQPPIRRTLPALITRTGKSTIAAPVTQLRRVAPDTGVLSRIHPPPPERFGDGVLFPALIVGVGGTGLNVLRQLRRLIHERYGQPSLPHLRWLYIDTDPKSVEEAVTGSPAFRSDEVLLTRLHRPAHYLTRDGLPSVDQWLSAEELYKMPKSPVTNGVRALGRLALCDHHHAIVQRLRLSLEPFAKSEPIADAEGITKLGLRTNYPRAYVAASLAGGTGSGMFLDMAYALRRELRILGFNDSQVIGLLGVPVLTPDTKHAKTAGNARAALTELAHYNRAEAVYSTLFDTREKPVTDSGRPFRRCSLVRMPSRYDRRDVERASELAAHVAYGELLAPIGRAAYPDDVPAPGNPVSLVGLRKITWPRAAILQSASRLLAKNTMIAWSERTLVGNPSAPADVIDEQWNSRHLGRSSLREYFDESLNEPLGSTVAARIDRILGPINAISPTDVLAATQIRVAFNDILQLLGRTGADETDHPNEVGALLTERVQRITDRADEKLAAVIVSLIETPGLRLAAAEEAVRHLLGRIDEELDFADREWQVIENQTAQDLPQLLNLVAQFERDLASRIPRRPAEAATALRHWAVARYQALVARACANVYRVLRGNIPEYIRDVNMCRSQLANYLGEIERMPAPNSREGVLHDVFPNGSKNVAEAAAHMVNCLSDDDLRSYETSLQQRIQKDCKAVISLCLRPKDVGMTFATMLVEEAWRFLDESTPRVSAAQIIVNTADTPEHLEFQLQSVVESAAPLGLGPNHAPTATVTVLAVPTDEPALAVRSIVRDCASGSAFVATSAAEEIIILRESRNISIAALPHVAPDEPIGVQPSEEDESPSCAYSRIDVAWSQPATT